MSGNGALAQFWALGGPPGSEPDEFDLDVRWGELAGSAGLELYLPTAREIPGETCDSHAVTCHNTCPGTCHGTCAATCHSTCADTCGGTCYELATCAGTCVNTHCFTCRSGCQEP